MSKVIFYTRYGLNLGGVGKILNEILESLSLKTIELVYEKELNGNGKMLEKFPKNIKKINIKEQEKFESTFLGKIIKKAIEKKKILPIYLLARVLDRLINLRFKKLYFKKNKIDVLVDFDFNLYMYIKKINASKKIVWLHANPKAFSKNRIEKLKYYDKIIVICNEMKEILIEIYPELKNKIDVIYNPIDHEKIITKSFEEKEYIKENYSVSVMRLDQKQKDFITIIRAIKKLKNEGIKINHYIIGDGPDKEKIQYEINKNNLFKEIKLLGQKNNPYGIMKNANYLIHSSKYEGLPTVLIESLFLNVPIISSNCKTGILEILDNGNQGLLYKVGSEDELLNCIKKFEINKQELEIYKEKNKIWVKKFFKSKSIKKIDKLIEL